MSSPNKRAHAIATAIVRAGQQPTKSALIQRGVRSDIATQYMDWYKWFKAGEPKRKGQKKKRFPRLIFGYNSSKG